MREGRRSATRPPAGQALSALCSNATARECVPVRASACSFHVKPFGPSSNTSWSLHGIQHQSAGISLLRPFGRDSAHLHVCGFSTRNGQIGCLLDPISSTQFVWVTLNIPHTRMGHPGECDPPLIRRFAASKIFRSMQIWWYHIFRWPQLVVAYSEKPESLP